EGIEAHRGEGEEIAVRRKVQLGPGAGPPRGGTGDEGHNARAQRQQREDGPGQDLGAAAAAEAERGAYALDEHGAARGGSGLARPIIAAIADVEDRAAGDGVLSCSHRVPRSNSSVSARRRGASRRNAAPDSTTASRTWS